MSLEFPCVHYENGKCKLHSDPEYTEWCHLGPCPDETASNADLIRRMTDEQLAAAGIPAGLVRLSCGLESSADLIADLEQALEQVD